MVDAYMADDYMDDEIEDALMHFGVKGMKWGVRKKDPTGADRSTSREARKDAQEFARAKMFYGEGAGTRRKLIKAQVEAKSKRNGMYKKSFDWHMENQDLGNHATKARRERKRKDVVSGTAKTARGVNRAINGPFAAGLGVTAITFATQTQAGQNMVQNLLKRSGL